MGKQGLLNFVGGCSGALPAHIAALAKRVKDVTPRRLPELPEFPTLQLSSTEAFFQTSKFQLVGGKANVNGSKEFTMCVHTHKWDEALEMCQEQIANGADLLDFNLDSALLDGKWALSKFVRMCTGDPVVGKVPFMVGSRSWIVLEEGLKHVQGKAIVNAICLSIGEEKFLLAAEKARQFGAAIICMVIDEKGRAETYQDKVRIAMRMYELLRSKLDFPPEDIIFDLNLLKVGIEEHRYRAIDHINAVAEIKRRCPCVSTCCGLNNVSLAVRGLSQLRESMHSVFLYHAIQNGLDMAICEPGKLPRYSDVDDGTRKICEEIILDKSSGGDHVERFLAHAAVLWGYGMDDYADYNDYGGDYQIMPYTENLLAEKQVEENFMCPVQKKTPLHTMMYAAGTISGSAFTAFGSKAGTGYQMQRFMNNFNTNRLIAFSSISAWMGQGGSPLAPGASILLDSYTIWTKWQSMLGIASTVQWGPIGDIGLRRTIYGSRDVFAAFSMGQELISAGDTQYIERVLSQQNELPDFFGIAYVDDAIQTEWDGLGKINIKIQDKQDVITLKMRAKTPVSKLVGAYCAARGVAQVAFTLHGRPIPFDATIAQLNLGLNDVIFANS
eukprot:gnl/TRDRNA2_/TRDRNA2_174270_c18_seq1.p1 gnl/TRDRNA2_/TRDRNA2_174270_c18~~gnl/TRDRNA2_/TRDRNA2_174270_c18_seq1.p1  ORF type:complete len:671 (-),score=159.18 gnl/TRDRNA2_/TRDRNA2_174270_c18_seq1:109-1944(-)